MTNDRGSFFKREDVAQCAARVGYRLAMEQQLAGLADAVVLKASVREKPSFVTDADKAVESYIAQQIRSAFPDDVVIGEEGAVAPERLDGYVWIIDPIDGTANFSRGLAPWAISVAMLRDGVPVIAAAVVNERLYETRHDLPGYYRDHSLHQPPLPDRPPGNRMVSVDNYGLSGPEGLGFFGNVLDRVYATRQFGSAVAEAVYVAQGKLDAYVHPGLALWDLAATSLIVEKAGGKFTRWDGSPVFPGAWQAAARNMAAYLGRVYRFDLLAASPAAHEALIEVVRPHAGFMQRRAEAEDRTNG